jgi:hypothetical protein
MNNPEDDYLEEMPEREARAYMEHYPFGSAVPDLSAIQTVWIKTPHYPVCSIEDPVKVKEWQDRDAIWEAQGWED